MRKIAIDIDDTICNTSEFFGELAIKFEREVLHKNNIINFDKVVPEYLDKNNIMYDEIITKSNDKYKYLDDVDYFVDDAIFNCEKALNKSNSKVIMMLTNKTRDYENDNIYKVNNWKEIFKYISSRE